MSLRDDIGGPVVVFVIAWLLLMLSESAERPVRQLPADTRRRDTVALDTLRVHIATHQ